MRKPRIILFFLFFCFGLMHEALSATAQIINLRFSNHYNKTRLVFDATNKLSYNARYFQNKIVINLKNTKLAVALDNLNFSHTPILDLQSNVVNKNNLKLILNLKNPIVFKVFSLTHPYRLVIDLSSSSGIHKSNQNLYTSRDACPVVLEQGSLTYLPPVIQAEPKLILKPQESSIKTEEIKSVYNNSENGNNIEINKMVTKTSQIYITNNLTKRRIANEVMVDSGDGNSRDILIVVDPGHGGKDSGAIGLRKTYEKHVALAISKILQNIINSHKGFKAVLTRNGDYFIHLRQRLDIAHRYKADMFISIHADAYKSKTSYGASVFALSARGATSEAARWLAEQENESELGAAISDKNAVLRSVLIDLAQTATISSSLEIGNAILRELNNVTHLHSTKVEQAGFVVLKSPDIPSLLIETGFISDLYEEELLRNPSYQHKIAGCLADGVISYFMHHPPHGTYISNQKNKSRLASGSLRNSLP